MPHYDDDDDDPVMARRRRHERKVALKNEESDDEDCDTLNARVFSDITIAALKFTDAEISRRETKYGPDPRLSHNTVRACITVITLMTDKFIGKHFIKRSVSLWGDIRKRDLSRFENSITAIFSGLPESSVKEIVDYLLDRDKQTGEFKTDVNYYWEALERLVRFSIRYVHERRKPVAQPGGNFVYEKPRFMRKVDVQGAAREWGIDLTESIVIASRTWLPPRESGAE